MAMTNRQAAALAVYKIVLLAFQFVTMRFVAFRILIVDIDVHHGQGTQLTFYDDPRYKTCNTCSNVTKQLCALCFANGNGLSVMF